MSESTSGTEAFRQTAVIGSRYAGFPDRALGGYVAGLLAGPDPFLVRLRAAVPMDVDLDLRHCDGATTLKRGEELLAEGGPLPAEQLEAARSSVLEAPSLKDAELGAAAYLGHHHHLFPGCFCCGPAREEGDGLRVFTGPLPGTKMVAATWIPPEPIGPKLAWSALDCPAIWAIISNATHEERSDQIVSGTMYGELREEIVAGEPHIVYAWPVGKEGRKRTAGAAIAAESGQIKALAFQIFITVDRGAPLDPARWGG